MKQNWISGKINKIDKPGHKLIKTREDTLPTRGINEKTSLQQLQTLKG